MNSEKENKREMPTWQEFQQGLIAKAMEDESFRKELLENPKSVMESEMAKLDTEAKLPDEVDIKVIEQPENAIYIVLPTQPNSELSDNELDQVSGGQCSLQFCGGRFFG